GISTDCAGGETPAVSETLSMKRGGRLSKTQRNVWSEIDSRHPPPVGRLYPENVDPRHQFSCK
ncbi:hypothetical protein A2U01_0073277, partial [Trifolium medium]|nr:hypothetical protein [Trifolium medium]